MNTGEAYALLEVMTVQNDPFHLQGRTISGAFRVDEVVAEGGYGVVYRAYHQHFRAPVALKVLKIPDALDQKSRSRFWEEFRKEAEVQFQLSAVSPHVVRPFHVGEVDVGGRFPLPMMALEWLEGEDLESAAERRRLAGLPPPGLRSLLDRLGGPAKAIHLAHNLEHQGGRFSVIHRDIKPENLYSSRLGSREVVKILDFGTSKVSRMMTFLAGAPSMSRSPQEFSPPYGAPEQWVPKSLGQTGPWTDVWAMALTLVELMKGEHVLTGDMYTMMFGALNEKERPTPRQQGLDVSDAVEDAFQRAMTVDPRQRTKSMRKFWIELRTALAEDEDAPGSFRAQDQEQAAPAFSRSRIRVGHSSLPESEDLASFPMSPETAVHQHVHLRTGTHDEVASVTPTLPSTPSPKK